MKTLHLKKLIKHIIVEDKIPGNASPEDQLHVFDFDDTLGVTDNPNGVMIFKDGKPAHTDVEEAKKWIAAAGLNKYLTNKGKETVMFSPDLNGVIFYVDSAGLAKVYKDLNNKVITYDPKNLGDSWKKIYDTTGFAALGDYSPSNNIDLNTTKPIKSTIDKLKSLNSSGAKTAIMTARQDTGDAQGLDGNGVKVTNVKDIDAFLSKQGAKPNSGIMGVKGQNKGEKIKSNYVDGKEDPPEEIHFYDDSKRNTDDVSNIAGKVPAELHIYGPGHFDTGEASAEDPDQSYEAGEKEKKVAEIIKKIVREELKKKHKKLMFEKKELSVQDLAAISDEALDNAYGYGRSSPGNTFGWQANLMSAQYAKKLIDSGVTDIEKISDAIHKGWNVTAQKFVQNPDQFDDTEKLRQAGKLDGKLQQRAKLMKINYAQLPDDEKEKDRVVARALLKALKGTELNERKKTKTGQPKK
jgi:hypothetical protein